ncbi:hypothetical protein TERTU_1082 [Teredinibacter turnerae T7901]|uniref:Uncharacterized protein n=1 Tax=Teredinibacter turnerae (strain ATCC 39867 / T7901) TaxID=377629 RepID=C5BR07_TERTT|nr:hypothetical protein TERTU_1082 [Teredinibacter turnerae T7901]
MTKAYQLSRRIGMYAYETRIKNGKTDFARQPIERRQLARKRMF